MPRQRTIQTNFTGGEFSPRLYGRPDLDAYANGAAELLNFMVLPQGGATRRPGTYYVTRTKLDLRVRLIPFTVSTIAAYVVVLGPNTARFIRNRGLVVDGSGNPVELATPWGAGDLQALRWAQSADTLLITHRSYAPQAITRTAANRFSIAPVNFQNGPYLPDNTGDVGTAGGSASLTMPETGTQVTDIGNAGGDAGAGGGDGGGGDGGGAGGE